MGQRQKKDEDEEEKPLQAKPVFQEITPLVQRQPEKEEEEETIQTKLSPLKITPLIQRQINEEEEEILQTKEYSGQTTEITPNLEYRINALKGSGRPLPNAERSFMERRFGVDFSGVRVHSDSIAALISRELNAEAFTYGRDVYFGMGRYSPDTVSGKRLLSHELTHLLQNKKAYVDLSVIRRICSPPQRRANNDPNEGQRAGVRQLPSNPCLWILYGFHIDSGEFKVAFTPAVNLLAEFLRTNAGAHLELIGLNDCFGSVDRNIILGNRRSQSVKNAFTSGFHARISLLPSDGRSYLIDNNTPLHRAINRSVQIRVMPPQGVPCPAQISLEQQLTPTIAGICTPGNRTAILTAARYAVPLAITALARVRNWRNSLSTRNALDLYFATTSDAERRVAANTVATRLDRIIHSLQRPVLDCMEPGHWAYSRVCPDSTIADSQGFTVITIPTFCIPQFINLNSPEARAVTVMHEFSHRLFSTLDYSAYYQADTCAPSGATEALPHSRRLLHADSFACFVGVVAIQPP